MIAVFSVNGVCMCFQPWIRQLCANIQTISVRTILTSVLNEHSYVMGIMTVTMAQMKAGTAVSKKSNMAGTSKMVASRKVEIRRAI